MASAISAIEREKKGERERENEEIRSFLSLRLIIARFEGPRVSFAEQSRGGCTRLATRSALEIRLAAFAFSRLITV